MAENTSTAIATGTPDQGSARDAASTDVISRAEHEAAIEAERKRQAGLTRQADKLRQEIESLKATREQAVPREQKLPDLPDDNPYGVAIKTLAKNQQEWQRDLLTREQQAEAAHRMELALTEAKAAGVPEDELDDSSPEAIRASMREYLKDKQLRDMANTVRELKDRLERAPTQARAASGALTVSTATGTGQEPEPDMTGHRQLEILKQEQAELTASAARGNQAAQAEAVLAARAAGRVKAWIAETGGKEPMPKDWRPGAVRR